MQEDYEVEFGITFDGEGHSRDVKREIVHWWNALKRIAQ